MISLGTAEAATCNVPADYTTIQEAVNVPGCTTVNVAAGTYAESVNIPRAVILNGPNAGSKGSGARGAEAIVNDINITSSNVIVNGFSFANPGAQMNVNGTTSTILSGVAVENNIFSGYSSVGFPTYNAGNLDVTRNLFHNPASGGATEAMQIKADGNPGGGCNGTNVSNNVFRAASNNSGADINFTCTGSNSTGVTVSGNTDTGLAGAGGPSFTAFSGVTGGIVVSNNNVTGTTTSGSAVYFFGSVTGSVLIDSNHITKGSSSAISIHGAGDSGTTDTANSGTFTITKNDLSGNASGINVAATALSSGAKVIANRNNLSGNTVFGINNVNSASIVANGTCNWWGAANGPGPVGPGAGAPVSTLVTYSPWLNTSVLNSECNSGQTTVTIAKYLDEHMATAANANNTAFPMQSTWNASNIGAGTGNYSLSPTGFNNTNPYEATTSDMSVGASYTTHEVMGSTVATACTAGGAPYILKGYTTGDTLAAAEAGTPSMTVPNFSNLQQDEYVVVWNVSCTTPTNKDQCKDNGWKTFNDPKFKNKDQCIDYVVKHEHKISGDVKYTAYGLNRHAEFNMNTADNNGSFKYSDVNESSYTVKVSSVKVSGNTGWFAGEVTKASNPSWVGLWLFAKVIDNHPDQIWGSFTDQTTALNGVTNMTNPVDGPFNVTKGNLEVN
jgi:hypothetical protein